MKKYLSISILALSFVPIFASAEIIYHQPVADTRSIDMYGSGTEDKQIIKGTVIGGGATTTINQIYIWLETDSTDTYLPGGLYIEISCAKANATTTNCNSAEGFNSSLSKQYHPNGYYYSTTTINTTRASYKFAPVTDVGGTWLEDLTISPNGIYTFTIQISSSGSEDLYTYGSEDDIANSCWVNAYTTAQIPANCAGLTNSNSGVEDMLELSILLGYVSSTDTDTRIVNFSPSSTLIETDNTSEIVTFTTQWYYNPTEWIGTVGYTDVMVAPINIDKGISYTPQFMSINSSGLDTDYTTFELDVGLYQINVCFYYEWTGTGENISNLCQDYSLVVGTTTRPVSYLPTYDPLYGGLIPEGEEDCSALGSVTEKAGCYIANAFRKLFIPSSVDTQAMSESLKTGVLAKFPVGYVTSIVNIMNTEATTTFPIASFTISEGEYLSGEYSIDLGQIMTEASTIVTEDMTTDRGIIDSDTTENVWDMIMPTLETIGYSLLILLIILELLGFNGSGLGYKQSTHITSIKDNEISYETPGFSRYKK